MVLENKLGITNSADLAKEEEKLSKKRAVELFEEGLLSLADAGSFSSLHFALNCSSISSSMEVLNAFFMC